MNNNSERYTDLIQKILNDIDQHKDKVPRGSLLLDREKITGIEDVLEFLNALFEAEEREIEERQLNTFVTVSYEDGVRTVAVSLILLLYPKYNELKHYEAYRKLLVRKHMAYAFFHALNNNMFPKGVWFDYSEIHEDIYLGLVEFYRKFYGRFRDNEEAIELLCNYFPQKSDMERHKQEITEALYIHISNAGTPKDTGYAFQGIARIESCIGALPSAFVMELLGQYQVRFVVNNEVCRHQVFSVIAFSQTGDIDKASSKFLLLDSVILAQQLEAYLVQKLAKEFPVGNSASILFGENYITDMLKVYKEPDAYWSKGKYGERVFYLNQKPIVRMLLKKNDVIEISRVDEKRSTECLEIPYSYTDWQLEDYFSKAVEQKLRKFILGTENQYEQMAFSLLYLDNYRGIKNQMVDFNHKFHYDRVCKRLRRQEENLYQIENFHGQSVQTLTCIVGKNGMGKTSIIDFLRESFFKMLRLIEEYGISCKQGYLKEDDYQEYDILDKGARFLIVFQLGGKSLFLTNIVDVRWEGADPFGAGIYNSFNEFSKVAYFSNMLKNSQEEIFFEDTDRQSGDRKIREKREIGRSLRGFKQVDYSETESFIRRQKAVALGLKETNNRPFGANRELCYQFTFLKNMDIEKVCQYLDINENREFRVCSRMFGWEEESFSLRDLKDLDKINCLEQRFLYLPDAQIKYFSSGQYAKFAFLAKLYWFLEGYRKEIERYRHIIGENEFRREDALLEEETALIFIDEGETYYHPEWQRRYVKTLLEMMDYSGKGSKIQIVLTTNSPFILSDILKEDVSYLTGKNEKCFDQTLGQNIHRLLKENFFMDYTIGEYARELIESIMLYLKNPVNEERDRKKEDIKEFILRYYGKPQEPYYAMQLLIEQIGEPVYRYELEKLLDESDVMKEHRSLESLLEEKRRIEEKIRELEEKG